MPENHIIPVSNGVLEHRERLGTAIWEFLWCIDAISVEEVDEAGIRWGIVHGGAPVKVERIASELGSSERTVKRNLSRLKDEKYITTVRVPYGEIILVRNNKKKVPKRSAKYVTSLNTEVPNMSPLYDLSGREVPLLSERSDTNGTSNKDIKKDLKPTDLLTDYNAREESRGEGMPLPGQSADASLSLAEVSPDDSIARMLDHYIARRGNGFNSSPNDLESVQELVNEGIPEASIILGIDKSFDNYKPKYPGQEIQSFSYCAKKIRDLFYQGRRMKVEEGHRKTGGNRRNVPGSRKENQRHWDGFGFTPKAD
jgi:DNA-binding transcriptional regulator YhcF (GntR family)